MKLDKLIYAIMIIGILGFIITSQAFAEYRHPTQAPNVNISSSDNGTALAIAASQHNFDWSTSRYQASIGAGFYDGDGAVSFSVGKNVGDILINGSIGAGSEVGGGVGLNWRF